MEVWKDVIGYEGIYQISNLGRVKRLRRLDSQNKKLKEIIMKQCLDKYGYPIITLFKDKRKKTKTIHRLVAQAFIPNLDNKSQVNHINCIKTDNNVNNLEWCSNKENIVHSFKSGKRNIKKTAVDMLDMNGNYIMSFDSYKEAEKFLNKRLHISCVCYNKRKSTGNYRWRFKE